MSDKPAHVLEIPASLGRDIDKGKTPPIEAFMSDSALEQAEKATRAATEPVHAEDLRPISKAEATARTTFDGEHLPMFPSTRRVIPPPFARPRINGGRHGKTWQSVPADQVARGDMTQLVGLVAAVEIRNRYQTKAEILGVKFGDGPYPVIEKWYEPCDFSLSDLSEKVAVGTDVVLTGAGGVSETVDIRASVRVFRQAE